MLSTPFTLFMFIAGAVAAGILIAVAVFAAFIKALTDKCCDQCLGLACPQDQPDTKDHGNRSVVKIRPVPEKQDAPFPSNR